jgi:hypothetical protein
MHSAVFQHDRCNPLRGRACMRPQRLVQDYAAKSGQPIAPAASTFGAPAAPAFGAAAPAAGSLFGAAPAAGGGGMFGAPAAPAFGAAPSQFGAPAPGGMFGAAPAAAAPATGGFGFGSTGGGMFGSPAPAPAFGAAPAAFGSTGAGFGFGAAQVSGPSTPPHSAPLHAPQQPLHTDRLSCAVLSSVCDPWRNVLQSQPAANIGGFGASSAPSLFGAAPSTGFSFNTAGASGAANGLFGMRR